MKAFEVKRIEEAYIFSPRLRILFDTGVFFLLCAYDFLSQTSFIKNKKNVIDLFSFLYVC